MPFHAADDAQALTPPLPELLDLVGHAVGGGGLTRGKPDAELWPKEHCDRAIAGGRRRPGRINGLDAFGPYAAELVTEHHTVGGPVQAPAIGWQRCPDRRV